MSILVCENPNCQIIYNGRLDRRCRHNYCSHSCSVTVNNRAHPRNPGKNKICFYCGKNFKSRQKYCSRKCKDMGMVIPKDILLSQIKDFVAKNGRIPYKNEIPHYHAFRGSFGNWNNAIKEAGFDPNPVMFAKKYISNDGHKCDSLAEKIIDDFLYSRKINHQRQIPYPNNSKFTCDFVVDNSWIEFFGLSGQLKRYDQLKAQKLRLVKKLNINLIKIYPKDLFPKNKLSIKLNNILN